jgi:ferrochelatase
MNEESKTGVLAFNLGTPEAPDRRSVGRYLREFLSDRRVVDLPRWLWLPLLHLVIVPLRSGRSAAAYSRVWREEGSPLLYFSSRLVDALQLAAGQGEEYALGMRYGQPSIQRALEDLRQRGAQSLVVLPLYPQFSYTTTESGYDAVDAALEAMGWHPEQHRIRDYNRHPAWVAAVAGSIRAFRESYGGADRLLFSMHGIPQRYVSAGDPYQRQCEESVEAIVRALGLGDEEWMLTYQSRLGREPWLQPYTDKTLEALAAEGVRSVQVVCPGFAADCLETLEEIAMENRELFEAAGGKKLEYIPALNDSEAHVRALMQILDKN